MARNRVIVNVALRHLRSKAWESMVENDPQNRPLQVRKDKFDSLMALLNGFVRVHRNGNLARGVVDRLINTFVTNVVCAPWEFEENGKTVSPPFTLTISPTQACNLNCTGCYAASDSSKLATMDFDTFDRIIREKQNLWHSQFTVVSGGEPFMYKSDGKDLLDLAERHPEDMFMVYTNGTLIDREKAHRMAELANVSPAISVEGWREQTDRRRGEGVYERIMRAMANLREAGVPFGVSVTGMRNNWDLVTSREFVEHFFEEQGVVYMWIFQYMPIGRAHTLDMMVTPEQRKEMLERTWGYVRNDGYLVADFWNSGTASNGCISAGRPGGYLYINWDGDVQPCVFTPFAVDNIHDIYREGGNLNDALESDLFKRIRHWQDAYGYRAHGDRPDNWLAPCAIRDHFKSFLSAVRRSGAEPTDPDAEAAVSDPDYISGLCDYGRRFYEITKDDWQEEYLATANPERETIEQAS